MYRRQGQTTDGRNEHCTIIAA